MRLKNKKSGFTLLEIIIVVIILGVLVSIALPRFTSVIRESTASEAFNTFGVAKRKIEECVSLSELKGLAAPALYNRCNTWAQINMPNPTAASELFTYGEIDNAAVASTYTILATDASDGANTLQMSFNYLNGEVTFAGAAAFADLD